MSDTTKQKTDEDTAELGSVLQLSPHAPTDKLDVVSRGKDGVEYISLDEVYEVNGQEAFQVLAANCREYNKTKRLHKSGFNALRLSGMEGLVPGYDRLNTIKGGESWIDTFKKGFVYIIKGVKRFVIMVIDWVVLKVRTLLGFEKTEKELAIEARYSSAVMAGLNMILNDIGKTEGVIVDSEELFANLPANVTSGVAFELVHNKTKSVLAQLETLKAIQADLESTDKLLQTSFMTARASRSRYQQAIRKLQAAYKDQNTFSLADIVEFNTTIDKEMFEYLDTTSLSEKLSSLVEQVYGITLGNVGIDKAFKDDLRKHRETLNSTVSVKVTPNQYAQYRELTNNFTEVLIKTSNAKFDPSVLADFKDLIQVSDAEMIDNILAIAPGYSILGTTYAGYAARVSEYTATLEHLITIVSQVRRSIAGAVRWATKVDKMMIGYIARDVDMILGQHKANLSKETRNTLESLDDEGNPRDSVLNIDYEGMFITKHPYYAGIVNTYRQYAQNFRRDAKIFDTVNDGLRKLGFKKSI